RLDLQHARPERAGVLVPEEVDQQRQADGDTERGFSLQDRTSLMAVASSSAASLSPSLDSRDTAATVRRHKGYRPKKTRPMAVTSTYCARWATMATARAGSLGTPQTARAETAKNWNVPT